MLQIDIEIYYTIVICHHSPIVVHLWCHLNGTFLRIMNGSNFIIIQMIKFILISWVMSLIGPLLDLSGIYTIVVTCILIRLPTEHISFVVWWQFWYTYYIQHIKSKLKLKLLSSNVFLNNNLVRLSSNIHYMPTFFPTCSCFD